MATFSFSTTNLPIAPVGRVSFCPDMADSNVMVLVDSAKHGTDKFYVYSTIDGSTWSVFEPSFPGMNALGSPCYINNRITVLGSSSSPYVTAWSTLDGSTWIPSSTLVPTNGVGRSAPVFDGVRAHQFPNSITSQFMASSIDGITWTHVNSGVAANFDYAATDKTGLSVFANSSMTSGVSSILLFKNGAYTAVGRPAATGTGGLAYDGDVFMLLDRRGNRAFTSATCEPGTWVQRTMPVSMGTLMYGNYYTGVGEWKCLLACANTFIALNGTSTVYLSEDNGATWTNKTVAIPVTSGTVHKGKLYMWGDTQSPTIVVGTSMGGPKKVQYSVDVNEYVEPKLSVFRRWYNTIVETITGTFSLNRKFNANATISETQSTSAQISRLRSVKFPIQKSLTYTGVLSRLRRAMFSVLENETISVVFDTKSLKNLQTSIQEASTVTAVLRIARTLSSTIASTEVLQGVMARARSTLFSVTELQSVMLQLGSAGKVLGLNITVQETIDALIARTVGVSAECNELIELSNTLSVLRSLESAIQEAIDLQILSGKGVEFNSAVQEHDELTAGLTALRAFIENVEQGVQYTIALARTFNTGMSIDELMSIDAAIQRLRAVDIAVLESEELVFNFGRTRAIVTELFETEELQVAIERYRGFQTDIAEVFDYALEIQYVGESSDVLYLTITWDRVVESDAPDEDTFAAKTVTESDTLKLKMRHSTISQLLEEPNLVTSIKLR